MITVKTVPAVRLRPLSS